MATERTGAEEPHASAGFGTLLKQYRLARGLSREALAERAGLSADAISSLERGRRQAPYRDTVAQLASALALEAPEQAALESHVDRRRATLSLGSPRAAPSPALHNLPTPTTALLGRTQAVGQAVSLLQRTEVRLLTLTGAGGIGKTRLAIEIVRVLLDDSTAYPDGIWFVELAPLADPALVMPTVAATLGLQETPGAPLFAGLREYLAPKRMLLVLDNCEHLIEACAALTTTLLRSCPHLRILATSREALAIAEETIFRVPSLAFPDPNHLPALVELPSFAAVALLLQRAQARRDDIVLTAANAPSIARICARLDGIPLAIELAAARLSGLPVEHLAARLDDCFKLLTGSSRTAVPRQRTLRATMNWSHALLNPPEQILLRRLAVFAGGWTLEAAEAVCADGESASTVGSVPRVLPGGTEREEAGGRLLADAVPAVLIGLVDKSLVLLEISRSGDEGSSPVEARYRLLETVRQYAQERLEEDGEDAWVRDRHLDWYLKLAEADEAGAKGPAQVACLDRLEREHDNLRVALTWSARSATRRPLDSLEKPFEVDLEAGPRLAGALWWFWRQHGHQNEGLQWLEEVLAASRGAATVARARALVGAGYLTLVRHEHDCNARARILLGEALELAMALGDRGVQGQALFHLGLAASFRRDIPEAHRLYEASLILFREVGDGWSIARTLYTLVNAGSVFVAGKPDLERDVALMTESLQVARAIGHPGSIAQALSELGFVRLDQGDLPRAEVLIAESLVMARVLGDKGLLFDVLNISGLLATQLGDLECACARFEEGFVLGRTIGHLGFQQKALAYLGIIALVRGDFAGATAATTEALILDRARLPDVNRDALVDMLRVLAVVAQTLGHMIRAAQLFGAAMALNEALGQPTYSDFPDTHLYGRLQLAAATAEESARMSLGRAAFAAAWERGRLLPLEEVFAFALSVDGVGDSPVVDRMVDRDAASA